MIHLTRREKAERFQAIKWIVNIPESKYHVS